MLQSKLIISICSWKFLNSNIGDIINDSKNFSSTTWYVYQKILENRRKLWLNKFQFQILQLTKLFFYLLIKFFQIIWNCKHLFLFFFAITNGTSLYSIEKMFIKTLIRKILSKNLTHYLHEIINSFCLVLSSQRKGKRNFIFFVTSKIYEQKKKSAKKRLMASVRIHWYVTSKCVKLDYIRS